ncbi:diguanylate cyclase [Ferrimonas aestuarii]|uniref:diguanylate cyclase n=2 Tax=Ferrimonas aestuarii TaxID=2569539 RepID=A0A4V5NYN8_9GAMM|nr:diguanylate cyclase [Ferrimonas aestuarii]
MMKSRFWAITAMIVGVLSTAWLSVQLYQSEQRALERDFEYFVENQAQLIHWRVEASMSVLYHLSTLYQGSDSVTEVEFANVADGILARHREITALEWVPKVEHDQRQALEQQLQQTYTAFTFVDLQQGQRVTAAPRDSYLPVYYLRPLANNEERFGLDLAQQPHHADVLKQAMMSGSLLISPVHRDAEGGRHIEAVLPIYHSLPLTESSREPLLMGFVIGVFDIDLLLRETIAGGQGLYIDYEIVDRTEADGYTVLNLANSLSKTQTYREVELGELGQRSWYLLARANSLFFTSQRSINPFIVAVGGIVALLACGSFLWQSRRQNKEIEQLVQARTEELNRVNQQLTRQSLTDGLTQIANRRQFDNWLSQEWESARRTKKTITLFVMDVDNFKDYNDRYGHLAGDRVLKKIARMLNSQLNRPRDLLARYGGEEFAAVLPETGNKAVKFADSLRAMVEALGIPHEGSDVSDSVTISIGVATMVPELDQTPEQFFELADQALYRAKSQGRNCVAYHNEQQGALATLG